MRKTVVSVVLAVVIAVTSFTVIPFTASAVTSITNPSDANGYTYTNLSDLASRLNAVFNGDIDMYTDVDCTNEVQFALGQSLNNSTTYYVRNNTTGNVASGMQCFIYANAVYNKLFNEVFGGLATSFSNSHRVVEGGADSVSYEMLSGAGVRCGAYIRTTNQSTGEYNGYSGHSMIILSYNETEIVVLDGNSNGRGLVRITVNSWEEFNSNHFARSNRYLCYIVQPTDDYYNTLYSTTHTHEWVTEVKDANCTQSGTKIEKCKECGFVNKTEPLSPIGHSWSGWKVTTVATCTKDGIQTNTCMNCGLEETKTVLATGHNWGEWHTLLSPKEDATGVETRVCKNCFVIETREIPALSSLKGDANGDGKITAVDARMILQIAAGLDIAVGDVNNSLDVNGDGKITGVDARLVLQIAAGMKTE